jgi:hemerythrin-like metal-binding protein
MVMKWTPDLAFGIEPMDFTHREFVNQLNALARVPDDKVMETFAALVAHTKAHFRRENDSMFGLNYPQALAHVSEHDKVLKVMIAVSAYMEMGSCRMGRMVARELAHWFRQHALTMDAQLARCLLKELERRLKPVKGTKRKHTSKKS